jgi:Flp pilus assembly protein TadB
MDELMKGARRSNRSALLVGLGIALVVGVFGVLWVLTSPLFTLGWLFGVLSLAAALIVGRLATRRYFRIADGLDQAEREIKEEK